MATINKSTAIGKGIRTGLQTLVGTLISLIVAVWAVPGVPEVVIDFATDNTLPLLLAVGIPSAVVAWIQNAVEQRDN